MTARLALIWLLAALLASAAAARVNVDDVGFASRLNAALAPDLTLIDEQGRAVALGEFLNGRPLILVLAYYQCPNLCGLVTGGVAEALHALGVEASNGIDVLVVSIDPRETPALAAAKKADMQARFPNVGVERGWHFLTGDAPAVRQLAAAVGFRYAYDGDLDQYAHPAGITLITGGGRVAGYLDGVRFDPNDLRLGLERAAAGRIGSPLERLLLLCYDYDPATGRYSLAIMTVLKLAALATAALLGGGIGLLLWRERRRRAPGQAAGDG